MQNKPYDWWNHDSWVVVFFFFFDMIYTPAGFKVSAEIPEGRFIFWCVWKAVAMKERGNIQIRENTTWWVSVKKNNERTALHGLGDREGDGSAAPGQNQATLPLKVTRKMLRKSHENQQLHLLSAGCGWNTLFSVEATCCTHMVQHMEPLQIHKNIYAASSLETESLFSVFLESAVSVSHQNGRLCWGFHHSGFVCVSKAA